MIADRPQSLDDWYRLVNSIHLFANYHRSNESVFTHFVECVGGLSILASRKDKPGVAAPEFIAKSVAWWFALCGKVGVRSVESLLWAKFPYVCPYCQQCPHDEPTCQRMRAARRFPDWTKLAEIGVANAKDRPKTLRKWSEMFYKLYPRTQMTEFEKDFSRLGEEIGELAEAIRALSFSRNYFLNEAADVFAWLIGIINNYQVRTAQRDRLDVLESSLWSEYPGSCKLCKARICKCPPLLRSSLGRIAAEMPESIPGEEQAPLVFTIEEAFEYFSMGDRELTLDGQTVRVDSTLILELKGSIELLFSKLDGIDSRTVAALFNVQELLAREEITQQSIDELIAALTSMADEQKKQLGPWLAGLTSSFGGSVLFELLRKKIGFAP